MNSTLLKAHKELYASSSIIRRGKNIRVNLLENNNNSFLFSYKGSKAQPYRISFIESSGSIMTNCTCPYDWGGWCKHQVAAANAILNLNKKTTSVPKINTEYNEFFLKNHIITENVFYKLINKYSNRYYSDYYTKITEIEPNKITIVFDDYRVFEQVFQYNHKKTILTTTCTCKESKYQICEHISAAAKVINDKFGPSIFHPNYLESHIDKFLSEYGLTKDDDYQQFFEFSLDKDGVDVKEKVKNLVPALGTTDILPEIPTKTSEALQIRDKIKNIDPSYGVGFCFSHNFGNKFGNYQFILIPFIAKQKKKSPDFTSLFTEIYSGNLFEKIGEIDPKDKELIFDTLEFNEASDSFAYHNDVVNLRKSSILFANLIKRLKNYQLFAKRTEDKLSKRNISAVSISNIKAILTFNLIEKDSFYLLTTKIKIGTKSYNIGSSLVNILPLFCIIKEQIYIYEKPIAYLYLNKLNNRSEITIQKKDYSKLYKEIVAPLSEHFEVKTNVYKKSSKTPRVENLKKQIYLSDFEGEFVVFKLGVLYDKTLRFTHSNEPLFDTETQQILARNKSFEDNFLEEFKDLHQSFQHQENPFYLTPRELVEDEWLLKTLEKMKHMEITVFGAKDLKTFKYNLHKPSISIGVKSNIDWFDLEIEVVFGKEKVSLKDIRKALINKSKYITLSDGSLGILPEKWLKKLSKYFKAGEVTKNKIKISNFQFNIIDELHEELENTPKFLLELQKKKIQLQNLETDIAVKLPKSLKATLRPYQKQGFNWLVFLDKNNLGGCLADDMGLGKTVQTIAFLGHLKKENKKRTHLIIMPTSLIFNWKKELEKFDPSLKKLIYLGANRKSDFKNFNKYDIVISTYGSLLNDIEYIKDFKFGYVILDESQAIKNPNSKRYKAVKLLQSDNRLALTGTPIENNTFDLYAQMNFLNPGLLGNMSHFKKEFSDAIDKAKDKNTSTLLSEMIHPFLLRRTKEEVASDLPEKTESILYCEMGVEQRKVYESFKKKYRDYLLNKIEENGVKKSQMYVLEGLTKLRQICNSPQLINSHEDYGNTSIKLDILTENIKEKTSNHKILVFSQFTSMLSLIKTRLDEENIIYEYLDGKTRNREEKVKNFQTNKKIRVFLISLKAGGTGLNLTAADYVFLVDPWWNPAVENQAIDRTHRIGQDKKVFAYKMICKNTIEEKIVNLQNKKTQVSNSVIQVDKVQKTFDKDQIKALFS